jgi:hypothetical protein
MRTMASIMRKISIRIKGGIGKGVSATQAKGPGVSAYNRPKKAR